jgi:hypothetical protein
MASWLDLLSPGSKMASKFFSSVSIERCGIPRERERERASERERARERERERERELY